MQQRVHVVLERDAALVRDAVDALLAGLVLVDQARVAEELERLVEGVLAQRSARVEELRSERCAHVAQGVREGPRAPDEIAPADAPPVVYEQRGRDQRRRRHHGHLVDLPGDAVGEGAHEPPAFGRREARERERVGQLVRLGRRLGVAAIVVVGLRTRFRPGGGARVDRLLQQRVEREDLAELHVEAAVL